MTGTGTDKRRMNQQEEERQMDEMDGLYGDAETHLSLF